MYYIYKLKKLNNIMSKLNIFEYIIYIYYNKCKKYLKIFKKIILTKKIHI